MTQREEFDIRGKLAASLKCWHRLTGEEAAELVALFAAQAAQPAQVPMAWEHEFIGGHKRLSYTPHLADVNGEHRNDAIRITPLSAAPSTKEDV